MNVTSSEMILLAHASFGVLGTLSAVWVAVETLNAKEENVGRIRKGAFIVAACMLLAWIFGGYWYIHFYSADKAIILKGPWPFAHTLFMETKEHLFFLTLILSLYLPIAARGKLYANSSTRKMVLCISMLIVLSGLAMEGFGAIVNHGAEVALKTNLKEIPLVDSEIPKLDHASAAFGLSAAVIILLNTIAACAKDACKPLKVFMASLSGSDWMNQGLADVLLFILLGFILLNTSLPEKISSKYLISFLVVGVVIAGAGLFTWYALY